VRDDNDMQIKDVMIKTKDMIPPNE